MILYPWVIYLMLNNNSLVKKLEEINEVIIALADHAESMNDANVASGISNELDALIGELVETSDEASGEQQKPAFYKGTVTIDLGYTPDDGDRIQEFSAYFTSRSRAKKETHIYARELKKSGLYDSVKESVSVGKEGDWKYEE